MRVLIVDDDLPSLKMNSYLLREEGYEVLTATNGADALTLLDTELVDLIILDVMMPMMDGHETLRRLRQRYDVPVIFLSAKGETADKVKGLEIGADDYLAKPFEPSELLARVKSVMRRSEIFSKADANSLLQVGEIRLDPVSNRVYFSEGRYEELTPIEFRLLHALMRNAGRTLTHDALLNSVWGYEYDGYSNQIAVYIRRLRAKIEADPSDPRYLITVRGLGYKFERQS
ncbi:MAG: response regulator transcription factor [Ardenticatenales bacterium]|nr:response regulator transcription factor [Ardenticatenales bacterium]